MTEDQRAAFEARIKSGLELTFWRRWHLLAPAGSPCPIPQYRYALDIVGRGPGLRDRLKAAGLSDSRIDFAWPALRVAVEIDGGTWINGSHSRGAGYRRNMEKQNALTLRGWRILRYTGDMLTDGGDRAVHEVLQVIEAAAQECAA